MERRKVRSRMNRPVVADKFRVGDHVEVVDSGIIENLRGRVVAWEQWAQHHNKFGLNLFAGNVRKSRAVPVMKDGPVTAESCRYWSLLIVRKLDE